MGVMVVTLRRVVILSMLRLLMLMMMTMVGRLMNLNGWLMR